MRGVSGGLRVGALVPAQGPPSGGGLRRAGSGEVEDEVEVDAGVVAGVGW